MLRIYLAGLSGFLDICRKVLTTLIRETVLFSTAVELAEAHPKAVRAVAKACRNLVKESLDWLQGFTADAVVERACERLRISLSILDALAEGRSLSKEVRGKLPYYPSDKPLLLLDLAHSYVHEAIDLLKQSEGFKSQHGLLELLSEARRRSAPKHVYQAIYRLTKGSKLP